MADETTPEQKPAQQQAASSAPNYDEIFAKLDNILDKRTEGLAKSALKDNGIEESEISEIVKAYRDNKQSKAAEQTTTQQNLASENAQLKAAMAERDIDDAIKTAAAETKLDTKTIPYIAKLVDKASLLGADGKPDQTKISEAIKKLLDDMPALKPQAAGGSGFRPVGADSDAGKDADADKKLRAYFGLKT